MCVFDISIMYLIVYYMCYVARAQVLAWSTGRTGYTVGWKPAWWLQEFFVCFFYSAP